MLCECACGTLLSILLSALSLLIRLCHQPAIGWELEVAMSSCHMELPVDLLLSSASRVSIFILYKVICRGVDVGQMPMQLSSIYAQVSRRP